MRVYELARELGLDNKEVVQLCEELGIDGKKSHSNAMTDLEADKVRRAVMKRNKGETNTESVREVHLNSGQLLTERRVGNVIRRRKKSDGEGSDLSTADDSTDIIEPTLSAADDLFIRKSDDIETVEDGESESDNSLSAADDLFLDDSNDLVSDAEVAQEPDYEDEVASEVAPSISLEASENLDLEEVISEDLSEVRRRHDIRAPKILGKISLPKEPVKVTPVAVASTSRSAAPKVAEESDSAKAARGTKVVRGKKQSHDFSDTDSEAEKAKKRRKQILRKDDLLDYDNERENWRGRKDKKKKHSGEGPDGGAIAPMKASKRVVKFSSEITVGDLAHALGVKAGQIVKSLMDLGTLATINQVIDFDTATVIAADYGFTTTNTGLDEGSFIGGLAEDDKDEDMALRPPVVTVMGHVDHGKTSLLDVIRKTSVTAGEAGGITQHIGAYNVPVASGGSVTFLDTPGHEAFTAMRSRGAKVTDIVVLVVAADDGVMPQTVEAINHAKAAGVPIIVAINKIDKEGINLDRVRNELAEHDLISEEWGGDTIMVPVSAHTGKNIDLLLENLQAQSEILELKANPGRPASGTVVESRLDKGRGPVVSMLVQNGTLRKGDVFLSGGTYGRVRALIADDGSSVEEAGPSIPVEILGASSLPLAGDDFYVVPSEAEAKRYAEMRSQISRRRELTSRGGTQSIPLTLENFSQMASQGDVKELALIVKADVQGSVEAVTESLLRLSNEEVAVKVVHKGVGAVSENDINLAIASNAIVIAFNVRADSRASVLAESEKVTIRYSRIIYELVEVIDTAIKGMLAPEIREKTLGRAEVRQIFKVPRAGVVAGTYVLDGTIERGAMLRLLRDNRIVFEGKMASLRRFKDDVKEVATGYECGIGIEGYTDIRDGDVIEAFKMEEIRAI
ncbi:MAG: translation initiation factor IF-2 [bacterium]|nr:translation initiation factor IF-2 [bacterium]